MSNQTSMTTGEAAKMIGAPGWLVRRLADRLFPDAKRAGLYRLLTSAQVAKIEEEIGKRKAETAGVA